MGLMDDYKDLGARLRFIVQCGICLIMIMTTGIYVKTLGNIAGIGEVNLGVLGIPFTMVAVVGFINALNMTDGIDGLAGGLALVALISMFVFQSATGNFAHFDKLMLLAVVIVPYMIANLGLLGMNRIFLGDAGSMLVGYMIAWAFIILAHPSEGSIEPVTRSGALPSRCLICGR